jgi:aspartyl protease family protein
MNVTTARRIGISLSPADFVHAVTTANGRAKAATARIERIEIGPIREKNVEAIVLEDSALSGTLIGMSFLRRLSKVEVVNDTLVLQE